MYRTGEKMPDLIIVVTSCQEAWRPPRTRNQAGTPLGSNTAKMGSCGGCGSRGGEPNLPLPGGPVAVPQVTAGRIRIPGNSP